LEKSNFGHLWPLGVDIAQIDFILPETFPKDNKKGMKLEGKNGNGKRKSANAN
jgi:hypothetical protein